jgi:S-formylglutathione hydrolase FrmB
MKRKLEETMRYPHINIINKDDDPFCFLPNEEDEDESKEQKKITESENFRIETIYIDSKFANEKMSYLAVVPKSYTHSKSYPVLFLLHGLRDDAYDWIKKGRLLDNYEILLSKKSIGNMIIILPNSGYCGESWYTDFKNMKDKKYESYFIEELIPDVKERFHVKHIGISGFSMGGYGAFKLALKHLGLFRVIGSFAGAISLVRLTVNKRVTRVVKFIYIPRFLFKNNKDKEQFITIFGSWGRKIIKEDPYTLIKRVSTIEQQNKHFYLSVGSEDKEPYNMIHQWVDMIGRLKRFNIPFDGYLYMGETHSWDYIARDLSRFLKFSWKHLKGS